MFDFTSGHQVTEIAVFTVKRLLRDAVVMLRSSQHFRVKIKLTLLPQLVTMTPAQTQP